jgi:hypothetical protein
MYHKNYAETTTWALFQRWGKEELFAPFTELSSCCVGIVEWFKVHTLELLIEFSSDHGRARHVFLSCDGKCFMTS